METCGCWNPFLLRSTSRVRANLELEPTATKNHGGESALPVSEEPTALFDAVEQHQWPSIAKFLKTGVWPQRYFPDKQSPLLQAKTWVQRYQYVTTKSIPASIDVDKEGSARSATSTRRRQLQFLRLPLHEAIQAGAPSDIVRALVALFPLAVQCADDRGMLPLHWAFQQGSSDDVLSCLLRRFPVGMQVQDQRGRFPVDCVPTDIYELLDSSSNTALRAMIIQSIQQQIKQQVAQTQAQAAEKVQQKMEQLQQTVQALVQHVQQQHKLEQQSSKIEDFSTTANQTNPQSSIDVQIVQQQWQLLQQQIQQMTQDRLERQQIPQQQQPPYGLFPYSLQQTYAEYGQHVTANAEQRWQATATPPPGTTSQHFSLNHTHTKQKDTYSDTTQRIPRNTSRALSDPWSPAPQQSQYLEEHCSLPIARRRTTTCGSGSTTPKRSMVPGITLVDSPQRHGNNRVLHRPLSSLSISSASKPAGVDNETVHGITTNNSPDQHLSRHTSIGMVISSPRAGQISPLLQPQRQQHQHQPSLSLSAHGSHHFERSATLRTMMQHDNRGARPDSPPACGPTTAATKQTYDSTNGSVQSCEENQPPVHDGLAHPHLASQSRNNNTGSKTSSTKSANTFALLEEIKQHTLQHQQVLVAQSGTNMNKPNRRPQKHYFRGANSSRL